MTSPLLITFFAFSGFLGVSCVTIVRKEKAVESVELGAAGTMQASSQPKEFVDEETKLDMCDYDYQLGNSSCSCAHEDHYLILDESVCQEAAAEAGATAPVGKFAIHSDWYHKRPKGCFKFPCTEDPKGVCFFYNGVVEASGPAKCGNYTLPDGSQPDVEGTPVCKRAKFLNGTVDGVGGSDPSAAGCPDGYQVIMNENNCSEADVCLGYCEGGDFVEGVANASQYNEYPEGCFIHKVQGCVYFNPPRNMSYLPRDPDGQPICKVLTPWAHHYSSHTS